MVLGQSRDISLILYALCIGLGVVFLISGNNWLIQERKELHEYLARENTYFKENMKKRENIDQILEKIKRIQDIFETLKYENIFIDWFHSDGIHDEYKKILCLEIDFLIGILLDLQKDLSENIESSLDSLSKIHKTLNTTLKKDTPYADVLEQQKERIEIQMNQFHQLKNVLVTV
jgi:hypothetical protein